MPRASRKDRKVQRERAQRALYRGLPALAPEVSKPRQVSGRGDIDERPAGDAPKPAATAERRGWLSQWPLSLKLLALATLLVLAFSLWRTIATRTGP